MTLALRRTFGVALCIIVICGCAQMPTPADWSALKIELEEIFKTDQALRKEHNAMLADARAKGSAVNKEAATELWKRINEQDRANQQRVAEIFDQYGWPRKSQVGPLAATAAFLVVQHANQAYQTKYIDQMREAAFAGEASKSNFALLEDRVLLGQGKPQRYGSQIDTNNGVTLKPTEDEANLDARRATMGLGPICAYLGYFVKTHGKIVYPPCAAGGTDTN